MPLPQLLAVGALALYAGLRLRRLLDDGRRVPHARDAGSREAAGRPIEDVLEEDPVCRRLVPRRQALTARDADGVRYFCGEACRARFLRRRTGATEETGEEGKP